jgi:hypothetical protein
MTALRRRVVIRAVAVLALAVGLLGYPLPALVLAGTSIVLSLVLVGT